MILQRRRYQRIEAKAANIVRRQQRLQNEFHLLEKARLELVAEAEQLRVENRLRGLMPKKA